MLHCSLNHSLHETLEVNRLSKASWLSGPWSTCDRSCGKGNQSRDVWCVDGWNSNGGIISVLPDEFCPAALRPSSFQHCFVGSCFGADWVVSAWSGCRDYGCDQTHETRVVMCVGKNGMIHSESVCDSLRRPLTYRACELIECNKERTPTWFSSLWSACSVTCGHGKQFRKVFCAREEEEEEGSFQIMSDDSCHDLDKLSGEKECVLEDCQGIWMTSSFGKCSVSCGGGKRERHVWCFLDGHLADKSLCAASVPDSTQDCNLEACPERSNETFNCLEHQFGCCSDGITPAEGHDKANCPLDDAVPFGTCSDSEFGCCPDQLTPAHGPFADGCIQLHSCQDSEFGCCPDGITQANGLTDEDSECFSVSSGSIEDLVLCSDGNSCELMETSRVDATSCGDLSYNNISEDITNSSEVKMCNVSLENGPSVSTAIDLLHLNETTTALTNEMGDSFSNDLSEVISSNDFGVMTASSLDQPSDVNTSDDDNNFTLSQIIDLNSTTSVFHILNSPEFTSSNSVSSAAVNTMSSEDEQNNVLMTDGSGSVGCSISLNPTGTTDGGCETVTSSEQQKSELCSLPLDAGDCDEEYKEWFYNETLNKCVSFTYTGCGGNDNRFPTEYQCNSVCRSKTKNIPQSLAICILPPDPGPCNVPVTKWHYNLNLGLCQPFTFGGCQGNDNKFDTRKECETFCSVFDICRLPVDIGFSCSNSSVRYYFSPSVGTCLPFDYEGCAGNANRFQSFHDCSIVCKQVFTLQVDPCHLPSDPGPCQWFTSMFYYDSVLGSCLEFSWGGCGGNRNRFTTVEKCLENCAVGNKIPPQSTSDNQSAECILRSDPGPCKAYRPMWYYELMEKSCRRFLYGGCGGNSNRFETREECSARCMDDSNESNSLSQTSLESLIFSTSPTTSSLSEGDSVACLLPRDQGPCIAYQLRWYFDQLEAKCLQFHYSGCQGNANNFNSSETCEAACHEFIVHSISDKLSGMCLADRDPGPCVAEFLRYHWDRELRECRPFTYGGCQGNDNNFGSQDDCYESCGNDSNAADGVMRRRIYRPGDCYESFAIGALCSQRIRWYFDIISGDCWPFYYRGCDANGNNFHSHEDCTSFCLRVTELCGVFQCDLNCEFGHQRGPDGCLQCLCNDPCQNFNCEDNFECHLDNSSCVEDVCQVKPVCKPSKRSGACPTFSNSWVEVNGCKFECKRDIDCSETYKCCNTVCGKTCVPLVPSCAVSLYGCCPDGNTTAEDWSFRGCPEEVPSIVGVSGVIEARAGDTVSIPCKARGAPLPQINWYKDGNPIFSRSVNDVDDDDLSFNDHFSTTEDGSLVIRNLSRADDTATYTCRAFNSIASATKEYTLIVQVPTRILRVVPQNTTVYEGEEVIFECVAEGYPMPEIIWYRNDKPFKQTEVDKESSHLESLRSILKIESVHPDDHGLYECEAANGIGAKQRKSVWLEVLAHMYIDIITNGTNFTAGSQANIWCNVTVATNQPFRISWRKDGNVISPEDSRFHQMGNELVIKKLELTDSGGYSCVVERGLELEVSTIVIQVTEEDDGIPDDCVDKPWLANCQLLVRANLCRHRYYSVFCCRSCFLATRHHRP